MQPTFAQAYRPRWADGTALALIVIFIASGILTLSEYGLTWDEGLGNLFFGERYFHYFTTFQEKYVDFKSDLSDLRRPLHLYLSWMKDRPQEFPALPDTISAAGMELFAYRLGWMDPVDAFHLPKILLAGILLWAVYRFAARHFGVFAGLAALAFLALFPRFWGDMHFNPKDIPETVFFALTIFAFWGWIERPGWKAALLTGLAGGAALATKANGVFIPFVLAAGILPLAGHLRDWRAAWKNWLRYILQMGLMVLVVVIFYVASWPYLYVHNSPVAGLTLYWDFILGQGGRVGLPVWDIKPLLVVLTTMPEWMLLFVLLGMGLAFAQLFRTRRPIFALLLAWLIVPIARISMPGSVNFDGIRHFLEFLPAAAILAGLAAGWVVDRLGGLRPFSRVFWVALILGGLVVNTSYNFIAFGRYQHLYFNTLIGGFPGAAQAFGEGDDTDYWAGSFRQGMAWLNANAPANSHIQAPVAPWLVELTAPIWLRPDIQFTTGKEFFNKIANHEPVYLMVLKDPSQYPAWSLDLIQDRQPVHVISLQGIPLVNIYQISP